MRQLRQRVTLRAKTHPFNLDESKAYINQRLHIAGSNGEVIFEPEALMALYRYSGGIPRVVNMLCEHCLVSALSISTKTVSPGVIEAVARDFDLHDGTPHRAMHAVVPANPRKVRRRRGFTHIGNPGGPFASSGD